MSSAVLPLPVIAVSPAHTSLSPYCFSQPTDALLVISQISSPCVLQVSFLCLGYGAGRVLQVLRAGKAEESCVSCLEEPRLAWGLGFSMGPVLTSVIRHCHATPRLWFCCRRQQDCYIFPMMQLSFVIALEECCYTQLAGQSLTPDFACKLTLP